MKKSPFLRLAPRLAHLLSGPLRVRRFFAVAALAAAFPVAVVAVAAEPDTAPGGTARAKAHQCVGCHEIPGYKTAFPSVYPAPKIFGQNAEYIVAALRAYRDGARAHPSMVGVAAQLSDDDMRQIADFYAQNGDDGEKSPAAAAPEIAAACAACHGDGGNRPIANYPKLAGQHRKFLVQAMRDYQNGARQNAVMAQQSAGWSRRDIAELAEYFAAQEGDLQ